MCHGGERARWTPRGAHGARDGVRAAFAATGLPYASDAADAVARELDDVHGAPRADAPTTRARRPACAASSRRRPWICAWPATRRRWREVGALVDVSAHADADTVKEAAHAAQLALAARRLRRRRGAARADARDRAIRETAAKVDALEQRLATVMAAYASARPRAAATLAEGLARRRAQGRLPAARRPRRLLARPRVRRPQRERQVDPRLPRGLRRGARLARGPRARAGSRARLAQEYIYAHQPAEFDYWAGRRAGGDRPRTRRTRRCRASSITRGASRSVAAGKMVARLACLEKHAAKVEPARPLDEWELTTLGLAAVDVGQFDARHRVRAPRVRVLPSRITARCTRARSRCACTSARRRSTPATTTRRSPTCERDAPGASKRWRATTRRCVGRNRIYLVDALIGEKRYDEARAELALATEERRGRGGRRGGVHAEHRRRDRPRRSRAAALPRGAGGREGGAARRLTPTSSRAKLELGRALLDHHEVDEARTVLEAALAATEQAELARSQAPTSSSRRRAPCGPQGATRPGRLRSRGKPWPRTWRAPHRRAGWRTVAPRSKAGWPRPSEGSARCAAPIEPLRRLSMRRQELAGGDRRARLRGRQAEAAAEGGREGREVRVAHAPGDLADRPAPALRAEVRFLEPPLAQVRRGRRAGLPAEAPQQRRFARAAVACEIRAARRGRRAARPSTRARASRCRLRRAPATRAPVPGAAPCRGSRPPWRARSRGTRRPGSRACRRLALEEVPVRELVHPARPREDARARHDLGDGLRDRRVGGTRASALFHAPSRRSTVTTSGAVVAARSL